jgi:hypothetical protein
LRISPHRRRFVEVTWIFYLNGPKINFNYRNGLRANLFSQTASQTKESKMAKQRTWVELTPFKFTYRIYIIFSARPLPKQKRAKWPKGRELNSRPLSSHIAFISFFSLSVFLKDNNQSTSTSKGRELNSRPYLDRLWK